MRRARKEKSPRRIEVEKQFVGLARRYGGKVLFEMNQSDFEDYWDPLAKGICNGVSILWLRHQHSELQSRAFAFFDEEKQKMVELLDIRYREMGERNESRWERARTYFDARRERGPHPRTQEESNDFEPIADFWLNDRDRRRALLQDDEFAKALHGRMHRQGQVYPDGDAERERARVSAIMSDYGMTLESLKTFAGGLGKGHSNLGKFVAKGGTASILNTAKHAMAACNTLGKPRFFDPNFGAVEFKNGGWLGSFLSAFFKIPLVNSLYGGHDEYRKLRVDAERYWYEKDRVYTIH